jgi:glycerol-3-phosphate acyltransferase PlsY
MTGSHEARGSSPLSSTKNATKGWPPGWPFFMWGCCYQLPPVQCGRSIQPYEFIVVVINMFAVFIILSYLIGSIPFSLLLVRWTKGIDLRQFGSGNIGATNARRAAGTGLGIIALLGDALKGIVPVLTTRILISTHCLILPDWLPGIVATAAIVGHIFPVYFKCRPSGKGIATSIGSFLVLSPPAVAIMLTVLIIAVFLSKRMSIGSMLGIIVLPPGIWWFTRDLVLLICCLLVMVIIVCRHKDNIRRILNGTEPRIGK